jgi:hypothetical protein
MIEPYIVMLSKRTIKKISIIIGIVLIVLWFGGNLGFYIYLKSIFDNEHEKALNRLPEKLKLSEAKFNSENIYFADFKLKFPFYKKDIDYISPFFMEDKLDGISIKMIRKEDKGIFINFYTFPKVQIKESAISKIKYWILVGDNSFPNLHSIHYARLKDYSWWNLLHNIRLHTSLIMKAIFLNPYENYNVYDLETPYLRGFLIEHKSVYKSRIIDFSFIFKDKQHAISFVGSNEDILDNVRNIITTVQPIDDVGESYKEMEARYKGKVKSKYPKELLLISMISLEGTTIDNLEELIKIMKAKNYKQFYVDVVKEQIQYLKNEE